MTDRYLMVHRPHRHTWRGFLSQRIRESQQNFRGWEDCTDEERKSILGGVGRCLAHAWNQGGLSKEATLVVAGGGVRGVNPDEWDAVVPASEAFDQSWLSGDGMARLAIVLRTVPLGSLENSGQSFRKDQATESGAVAAMVRLTPTRAGLEGDGVRVHMNVEADARSAGYY